MDTKKTKESEIIVEEKEVVQDFFFPREGVTIKAHSLSEARRLLELEQSKTE